MRYAAAALIAAFAVAVTPAGDSTPTDLDAETAYILNHHGPDNWHRHAPIWEATS